MEGKMDMPAFDMIEGTDPGSTYLVFAKTADLKLGIRPLVYPMHSAKKRPPFLMLGFRLRAVTCSPDGVVTEAASTFGLPLKSKGGHASTNGGLELIALPATQVSARAAWLDGKMTEKLVFQIRMAVHKAGKAEFVVTDHQMEDFMNLTYEAAFADAEKQAADMVPDPDIKFY